MKMIKLILITSILYVPIFSISQTVRITLENRGSFCGFSTDVEGGFYDKPKQQQYITQKANVGDKYGVYDVVRSIEKALGFDVQIDVYMLKEENNCWSDFAAGGKRIIGADYYFLRTVNKGARTEWAAVSILAHEIGHHISGLGRGRQGELDADYWSGYALYKLGANEEAAIKCIMRYGTNQDIQGDEHPNKFLRAANIKQGWEDAQNGHYDTKRCKDCK